MLNSKNNQEVLNLFHPILRNWFSETFISPTPPQILGWPVIDRQENVLILAPTGSGKTLAAFLVCINKLVEKLLNEQKPAGVFILYISPLKALNYDIERNLEIPLEGIRKVARNSGLKLPEIRQAVRTGDTTPIERQQMLKNPPHLLITTPESLHLLLTSKQAREILTSVQYVIVDEIHAVSNNKRGTFLALLLERLRALTGKNFQRIGLSATQKPLDKVAEFLGGFEKVGKNFIPRSVTIIDAGMRKNLDLQVISPVEDMTELPEHSIWPPMYENLLNQIQNHRTTLIFANNRALVEKITTNINHLANNTLAHSHHGSISKEVRKKIEAELKAGKLPALVATATLELGIDMGAIDLVCQVESPPSVASGLQRVGRAGHLYQAASKGRLIPKTRLDLLKMAAITRAMFQGEVSAIKIPQNCLDVLAQQIVAMVAIQNWEVDALFELVKSAAPFQHLPKNRFYEVIEMLSGRFPETTFRDLKPKISWDRLHQVLYALPGSQRLAILNGGSIPETGQYPVYLIDGALKLGELEEEFVHEARLGDNFQLGTHTWKIIAIEPNRVLVQPSKSATAKIPFWKGGYGGIEPELGQKIGQLLRELKSQVNDRKCLEWLQQECHLDEAAARNLVQFLKAQQKKSGQIPDDRTIIIESFQDEMGDPRVILLSPYGRRVHYAWRLAIIAWIRQKWNLELETIDADMGILFRFAGADPEVIFQAIQNITPENIMELITAEIGQSALFGQLFRYNAGRALLLPRRAPGKRTPLYLLRMRARNLLEIVSQFESFPIVIETYRELFQDFLALEELKIILQKITTNEIKVIISRQKTPSPFCGSFLFDFKAEYMYEYDAPKSQSSLNKPLIEYEALADLLQKDRLANLLAPAAIQDLEASLQAKKAGYQARTDVELVELLHRLGDLTAEEISERFQDEAEITLKKLAQEHRVCYIFVPGNIQTGRWITTENFPIYRAAFQNQNENDVLKNFHAVLLNPENLSILTPVEEIFPCEILETTLEKADAWQILIEKYLQQHVISNVEEIYNRYGIPKDFILQYLNHLTEDQDICYIPAEKGFQADQWIYQDVLERLRRMTLARQRREVQPCDASDYVQFLLRWQHLAPETRLKGEEGLITALEQLQGKIIPYSIWENEILARRVEGYRNFYLDELIASGELIYIGLTGGSGENRELTFSFVENLPFIRTILKNLETGDVSPLSKQILQFLKENGASFITDIATGTGFKPSTCAHELWELIWKGLLTNDSFRLIRTGKKAFQETDNQITTNIPVSPFRRQHFMGARTLRRRQTGGRWALLPEIEKIDEISDDFYEALASQLLLRYGLVCREIFQMESLSVSWQMLYEILVRMEWRGEIKRGYFVKGLSGAQFALPIVADELIHRGHAGKTRLDEIEMLLINSEDPVNLNGSSAPWPISHPFKSDWRFSRHPNNYLILKQGLPILAIEAKGSRLVPLRDLTHDEQVQAVKLLPQLLEDPAGIHRIRHLKIEFWDDEPVRNSPIVTILQEAGFRNEFKAMILERAFDGV
ncbi:DEAD/DEAH box helicase [candidate division KSB1 bacterium]|nr:DEAD/DEAH box helicase [candidate division KSB1 bacterium]